MRLATAYLSVILLFGSSPSVLAHDHVDLSDVGDVYLDNTGAPEAQQAFLHGLAQLHNFEYGFAAEDFREAQRIDPDFALAYWGEAMTHNHPIWMQQDKEAALEILDKYAPSPAARQARAPTDLTRDLFAALDVLYGSGAKQTLDDHYLAYMATLFAKYPDNVDIGAFYALSIMGSAHEGREFGVYMQSAAISQNFISAFPRHPGIAHYLIHATDDPVHAPLGLKAAQAYADIAPNAAHAQHMTTHIFLSLGDWDNVIRANTRASEIVNTHRATKGDGPSGCGHYPSWLMYGYLQQGKRDAAHDIMALCHKNITARPADFNRGYYVWQRALYLLDTAEWDGDVAGMDADFGDNYAPLILNQVVNGWVSLKTDDTKGAGKSLKAARNTYSLLVKDGDKDGASANPLNHKRSNVNIMQLEAQILLSKGKTEAGLDLLREVVALELDLPYGFGPPRPAKPSLELLGETLVALGQFDEAKAVLANNLSRTPNKALSVAALAAAESGLEGVRSMAGNE
jgi:tetratricopeptide (TPR) repeat protein